MIQPKIFFCTNNVMEVDMTKLHTIIIWIRNIVGPYDLFISTNLMTIVDLESTVRRRWITKNI